MTPVLYHRQKTIPGECILKMKDKVTFLGNDIGEYLHDFQVGKNLMKLEVIDKSVFPQTHVLKSSPPLRWC